MNKATDHQMKLMWFIELDYQSGMSHGASLRFFNLGREIVRAGHEIYFVSMRRPGDDAQAKQQFVDRLKQERIATDHFEIAWRHPRTLGKLAHLAMHPKVGNRMLRRNRREMIGQVQSLVIDKRIDLCVFSTRKLLFLLPEVAAHAKTIFDVMDSSVLYCTRELKHLSGGGISPLKTIKPMQMLLDGYLEERFYGKRADANIVVSQVDKSYLDRTNNCAHRNFVLLNGVDTDVYQSANAKQPERIIFSGNMDFPPNYQAALWFIKEIFPYVLRARPQAQFVVAGRNPVAELLAHNDKTPGVRVLGRVEDMSHEIAQSAVYAAPLVTGGGFKNKVVEALMSGTFVVGTNMAVEFLDEEMQAKMLVANDAETFAAHLLEVMNEPEKYALRVAELQAKIRREFGWHTRAAEMIEIAQRAARDDGREMSKRETGIHETSERTETIKRAKIDDVEADQSPTRNAVSLSPTATNVGSKAFHSSKV